jgi:hypothetical protein
MQQKLLKLAIHYEAHAAYEGQWEDVTVPVQTHRLHMIACHAMQHNR